VQSPLPIGMSKDKQNEASMLEDDEIDEEEEEEEEEEEDSAEMVGVRRFQQ